jgi:hypothetical protein
MDNEDLKDILSDVVDPLVSGGAETNESVPVTHDVAEIETNISKPVSVTHDVAEDTDEIRDLVNRFKDTANEILRNYRSDRDQIEDTISFLYNAVQLGPQTPRVYVEMLVAALRTKAETSTNAVKVLDSLAKLLAAGKGTQIFMQNNTITPNDALAELLKTPEFLDESTT